MLRIRPPRLGQLHVTNPHIRPLRPEDAQYIHAFLDSQRLPAHPLTPVAPASSTQPVQHTSSFTQRMIVTGMSANPPQQCCLHRSERCVIQSCCSILRIGLPPRHILHSNNGSLSHLNASRTTTPTRPSSQIAARGEGTRVERRNERRRPSRRTVHTRGEL